MARLTDRARNDLKMCRRAVKQKSNQKIANEHAIKGKRILMSILAKLYKYGQISNEVFF